MDARKKIRRTGNRAELVVGSAVAALSGVENIVAVNLFLEDFKGHLYLRRIKVFLADLCLYGFGCFVHESVNVGLALQLIVLEYSFKEPSADIFFAHFQYFWLANNKRKFLLGFAANFC